MLGLVDAGFVQEFDSARPCLFFIQTQMQGQDFGDLFADTHNGVEGGHGFLKHHADFAAAQFLQGAFGLGQQIGSAIFQTAFKGNHRIEAHNALRQYGFAAAALADQCQFAARLQGKVDIVQNLFARKGAV